MEMSRAIYAAFTIALLYALGLTAATAGGYPDHPIKIIVPLAPGGATDTVARVLAKYLAVDLGQPVIVENRLGAGGVIGMDAAVRSAPDGYTLFVGNVSTNALNQAIYADQLRYKPDEALIGVSMLATIPHLLISSAKFPPKTVAELIAYAKAHPGAVNHASPGVGSYSMLDMLTFERAAGLQMVHVPYNGGAGQYLTALVSDEVQIAFLNASSVIEMVKAGRLRALAATTATRIPQLPDVPTMAEAGFPGIGTNAWQGLFAPAGTPKPIVDKLHASVVKALGLPEVKQTFAKSLIDTAPSESPEAFTAFVKGETVRWAKVVADLHVHVDK
jgi:tripartite-type tricarboxylate transporter receptor subunit TctC